MFLFHWRFKQEYPQVSGKVNQLLNTETVKKKKKNQNKDILFCILNDAWEQYNS